MQLKRSDHHISSADAGKTEWPSHKQCRCNPLSTYVASKIVGLFLQNNFNQNEASKWRSCRRGEVFTLKRLQVRLPPTAHSSLHKPNIISRSHSQKQSHQFSRPKDLDLQGVSSSLRVFSEMAFDHGDHSGFQQQFESR